MTDGMVIGCDVGTSRTKAAAFDRAGRLLASASRVNPRHYPRPGWVEQDPVDLLDGLLGVVREVLAAADARDLPAALGLSTQRAAVVAWNRRTGEALYPVLSWQDGRAREIGDRLELARRSDWLRERTGAGYPSVTSGALLRWLWDECPPVREAARAGELAWGTLDAWLLFRLTGGEAYHTDVSNAASTKLLNRYTLTWDEEVLELYGIPADHLPPVGPSVGSLGRTDGELLGTDIPIASCLGDQSAALLGHGCLEPGQGKLTCGTGSFLLVNAGASPPAPATRAAPAWRVDGITTYKLESVAATTGAVLQWLWTVGARKEDLAESARLAASVPDTAGVVIVPAWAGLQDPFRDLGARGAVMGLHSGVEFAHLVRAALEGVAYLTRAQLEDLEREGGATIPALSVDGGLAANPWLMQFMADLLKRPVLCREGDAAVRGAAWLAAHAAGVCEVSAACRRWMPPGRWFEPGPVTGYHDEGYARWREAVARASGWRPGAGGRRGGVYASNSSATETRSGGGPVQ